MNIRSSFQRIGLNQTLHFNFTHRMSPKIKKLAIATVIILVLFFVYKFFFVSDDIPTLSSQPVSNNGGDVTLVLNQLRSLQLDTSIFQDQAFATLVDYGVVLDPQPVGRVNPFAPMGQGVQAPQVTADEAEGVSDAEDQEETPPSEAAGS